MSYDVCDICQKSLEGTEAVLFKNVFMPLHRKCYEKMTLAEKFTYLFLGSIR